MSDKKFPYQNRSLKNIKGEIWKDVPGYKDIYEVSDYGRVKSLERHIIFDIPGRHTVSYRKPEKILSQGCVKDWNSISGEEIFRLTVTFCVSQQMETVLVNRLVWMVFKKAIKYKEDNICILHKDGDGRNNRLSNLQMGDRSKAGKLAYARGRGIELKNYFSKTSHSKAAVKRRKPVTQYDLNGIRIKIFSGINEASVKTGIHRTNLSGVARGLKHTSGGFIWRMGNGRKKIDVSYIADASKKVKQKMSRPVTQYNLNGQRIRLYPSISDAAETLGCNTSQISNAISGNYNSAVGCIWKKGRGQKRIDPSPYRERKARRAEKSKKKVLQYNMKGQLAKTFNSINEAAASVNRKPDTLSIILHSRKKEAWGFYWKFSKG